MKVKKYLGVGVLALLIIAFASLVAWGIARDKPVSNTRLTVVAAENFWGNIASQLGGSHVNVTSIISDPNADPHLYESNAANAAAVAKARVVIVNGVGYDDFMNKMLANSKNSDRRTVTAATILGVTDPGANPHLWYDIPRVHLVAEKITASFEAEDPAHKADYQANLKKFDASLQPLLATIDEIKHTFAGTPVVYTEPVPGYLIGAAGLKNDTPEHFAEAVEDGTEPSPADTAAFEQILTSHTARILLYNAQATSQTTENVKSVARQAGVPVIGVTETLPPQYKTYQSWQQAQLNTIVHALEQAAK